MKILLLNQDEYSRRIITENLQNSSLSKWQLLEASNITEGVNHALNHKLDLILLDVQFQNSTAFDFLSQLETIDFQLIFMAPCDDYALQAVKYNAVDYLIKPLERKEFNCAIEKVIQKLDKQTASRKPVPQSLELQNHEINRMILRDSQAIHFVDIEDIVQCKSENNYTVFSLIDGSNIVISKTLGEFEGILTEKHFFRSHRSHLINLYQIKKYDKREGGCIEMKDGKNVPLAKSRKDIFMRLVGCTN